MKKINAVLVVSMLAFCQSAARGQDAMADLKSLDAKLTEAFKTGDIQMFEKHLEDGYVLIDPRGGMHGKKKFLKHMKEGNAKLKDLKETDVKVRVFGTTAVVTGLLHVKGKVEDKEISPEYRWTRVYNKMGDEWKCVLEQHTFVHPKVETKSKVETKKSEK